MNLNLHKLNLPDYNHKIKQIDGILSIFDEYRNKFVALTPEEWVRQNFTHYLVQELNYPKGRIRLEMPLSKGNKSKRCDIVVFDSLLQPIVIIECKAPQVKITQKVFNQIGLYNISLKVNYLFVTNGLNHYSCKIDFQTNKFTFLDAIPNYNSLL